MLINNSLSVRTNQKSVSAQTRNTPAFKGVWHYRDTQIMDNNGSYMVSKPYQYQPYSWETPPKPYIRMGQYGSHNTIVNGETVYNRAKDAVGPTLTREESLRDVANSANETVKDFERQKKAENRWAKEMNEQYEKDIANLSKTKLKALIFKKKIKKLKAAEKENTNKINSSLDEYYKGDKEFNKNKTDAHNMMEEVKVLERERKKGALIDISVQNNEHSNKPMYDFLGWAKENQHDTAWTKGKLVATPHETTRVTDLIMESFGYNYSSISKMEHKEQNHMVKMFMKEGNFVDKVMKHVIKITKV